MWISEIETHRVVYPAHVSAGGTENKPERWLLGVDTCDVMTGGSGKARRWKVANNVAAPGAHAGDEDLPTASRIEPPEVQIRMPHALAERKSVL